MGLNIIIMIGYEVQQHTIGFKTYFTKMIHSSIHCFHSSNFLLY